MDSLPWCSDRVSHRLALLRPSHSEGDAGAADNQMCKDRSCAATYFGRMPGLPQAIAAHSQFVSAATS
jgi:hypothetical protein